MQLLSFFAVDHRTGAVLPSASVSVYLPGTTTRVSLFDAGVNPISNPATADLNGMASFRAADGTYDIVISSGGYTSPTIPSVQMFDISELATPRLTKSGAYTIQNADKFAKILLQGAAYYTVATLTAASYDSNFEVDVTNGDSAAGKLISIDGLTAFILWPKQSLNIAKQNGVLYPDPPFQPWGVPTAPLFEIDPSSGLDSNDGISQPFQTIGHSIYVGQGLVDYGRAVSGGLNATHQLAYGTDISPVTYNEAIGIFGPLRGTEDFTIEGDPTGTNKSGAVIQAPVNNYTVQSRDIGIASLLNLKLVAQTAGYYCVYASQIGVIDCRGVSVSSNSAGGHFLCSNAGHINVLDNYSVLSSCAAHWNVTETGSEISVLAVVNIPSAITVSAGFAVASQLGMITTVGSTFTNSGNVTGPKYSVTFNAMLNSGGVTLPGTVAGSFGSGGQVN